MVNSAMPTYTPGLNERMSDMKKIILAILFLAAVINAGNNFTTSRDKFKSLPVADQSPSFTFAILGDRTGGTEDGLLVLEQAVTDINVFKPDMLMTVGDLVQGYCLQDRWEFEARRFNKIMGRLDVPWYPAAGNHDVYWRGEGRPINEHDDDFEKYFGPLWYAFEHKNCWFIVLYTDEGDPNTGEKTYAKTECRQFSNDQLSWLKNTLEQAAAAKHIFLFMHHPRWLTESYDDSWKPVHNMLVNAGNVSAVFAGHFHQMKFDGNFDGIDFYRMGVTGAGITEVYPEKGYLDHFNLVTVRDDDFSVAVLPVGSVIDPKVKMIDTVFLKPQENWRQDYTASASLEYDITIPEFDGQKGSLKVSAAHTAGPADKIINVKLIDQHGSVIGNDNLAHNYMTSFRYPVLSGQKYKFIISDKEPAEPKNENISSGWLRFELDVIITPAYNNPRPQ